MFRPRRGAADATGDDLLEFWIICRRSHAYPGDDSSASFTDPAGPDVSDAGYRFFMKHPR